MAALLEMKGIAFRPRAYEKAALGIEALDEEAKELYARGGLEALEKISGVGKGIARHIEDLLTRGRFKEYDDLRKSVPVNISELIEVEGVGPRTVKVFWEKLKSARWRIWKKRHEAGRSGRSRISEKNRRRKSCGGSIF